MRSDSKLNHEMTRHDNDTTQQNKQIRTDYYYYNQGIVIVNNDE